MIPRFVLTVIMLAAFVSVVAETVTGLVLNRATEQPEPYATVRIFAEDDSVKAAAVTTTDDMGRFTAELPAAKAYRLIINAVGLRPVIETFDVADGVAVDLGSMSLEPDNELEEVTVSAQRPVVKREIDRLSYDVQADDEASTSSIMQILKKVPMVTVDGNNEIKIKGQSDFKIYKNGRLNKAFTQNPKDIFTAIPASTVKRIEVITDPGAREDAEGSSVILNIVTMDEVSMHGIMGVASLASGTNSATPMPGLYLTGQINKVMLSAYGGTNYAMPAEQRQASDSYGTYASSGEALSIVSQSRSRSFVAWSGLEASWELDTLNMFTFEAGFYPNLSKQWSHETVERRNRDGQVYQSYESLSYNPHSSTNKYVDAAANYQRSTRRKGETIILSYRMSWSGSQSPSVTDYCDIRNMDSYNRVTTDGSTRFLEQTAQVDWNHPFTPNSVFDTGAKYIHRYSHGITNSVYEYTDHTDVIPSDFDQTSQIAALYAEYRLRVKKVNIRGGVRYEYSHERVGYPDGSADGFSGKFNDVVPSAAFSWDINDANMLKMSYGMTINRPGIGYLNPAVSESPYIVSYGNPHLRSSKYHNVGIEYSLMKNKVYLQASANYSYMGNGVTQLRWVDDNDVIYSTYGNRMKAHIGNISMYLQWSPFEKTQLMVSGGAYWGRLHDPESALTAERWSYSAFMSVTQKLPWKLNLRGGFGMFGPSQNTLYQWSRPIDGSEYDWELSLSRSFLANDRLEVNLFWNRPFGHMRGGRRTYSYNSDYVGKNTSYSYRQSWFRVSVSFRFGSLNASVKKVRGIVNSDLQSVGSGGGVSSK